MKTKIILLAVIIGMIGLFVIASIEHNKMQGLDYFCFGGFPPHTISFDSYSDYLIFASNFGDNYQMYCRNNLNKIPIPLHLICYDKESDCVTNLEKRCEDTGGIIWTDYRWGFTSYCLIDEDRNKLDSNTNGGERK